MNLKFLLSPAVKLFWLQSLVGPGPFSLEASGCPDKVLNLEPDFNTSSESSAAFAGVNQHKSSSLLRLPNPNVESQLLKDSKKLLLFQKLRATYAI